MTSVAKETPAVWRQRQLRDGAAKRLIDYLELGIMAAEMTKQQKRGLERQARWYGMIEGVLYRTQRPQAPRGKRGRRRQRVAGLGRRQL